MPVVILRYDPQQFPEAVAAELAKALPEYVSSTLDVPENESARLRPSDIEVSVVPSGIHDVNVKAFEIMIFAHQYPERQKNLDERKDKIVEDIQGFLIDRSLNPDGWVWILLQVTSFGRIW
jgi:hypothetical protein